MTDEPDRNDRYSEAQEHLRARAESAAADLTVKVEDLAPEELQRLLHELRVHEIELELQNDELRMRQEEYQELYERYMDLYNFAPIGYAVVDRQGRIVEANLTLGRLLGVVRAQIVDGPLARFVVPEDQDLLYRNLRELHAGGERRSWRLRLRRADGDKLTCLVDAQPATREEGDVVQYRLAFTDISALAEVEAIRTVQHQELQRAMAELQATQAQLLEQERSATVGQLAAGIAHDFNNILASILLYGQMTLRSEGLTAAQRRWIASMISESRRGSELVQQILDFGQRATLAPERFSVGPFVQEVAQLLSRTLPDNVDVRTISEDESLSIYADRARMQQVLVNLALNARDAMPFGGRMTITTDRSHPDPERLCAVCGQPIAGRWVMLTVADTGQGIPDDVMPRIFEPFFSTRSPEGHGLGLPQVAGIVAQHSGHITVDTTVGEGTTVRIYLPEAPDQVREQPAGEDRSGVGAPALAPMVLVVEDNPTTRSALAEALSVLGYRSEIAIHGREALEILSRPQHGVDVVLCDWVMPQMGGEELLDAMAARGIDLPVVAVSGHPMRYFDRTETIQVADWLQKPVDLSRLGKAIAGALR